MSKLHTWQHGVVYDHLIVERSEKWNFRLSCNLRECWLEMLLSDDVNGELTCIL